MRARTATLTGVALAAAAAGGATALGGGDPVASQPAAAGTAAVATATVARRDLVDRESVSGTLGYADQGELVAGSSGVLTRLRREGSSVRRGGWLYELDGSRTGWLLYGRRPAWRDFTPGMGDGEDVRQLERNLRALGYDPGEVDEDWTAATTAAAKEFQADRGLTEDGTLARGELVFRRGAVRVGEAKARPGAGVAPGTPLGDVASTRREVVVDMPADRQDLARPGARVRVELPTGGKARGRVVEVGSVAKQGEDGGEATVAVRVRLRGRAARKPGLDQAPVDVAFEAERSRDVLAVPVTALLAQEGGGFAVEVVDGARTRLVPVRPGLYANGMVAVEGAGLREGMRVVVPA